MNNQLVKRLMFAFFIGAMLWMVYAQDSQKPGEKRESSYAPVDIKESFATILARMKAAKGDIMQRQMALLNQRYDLSRRVTNEVTMSRGKPLPVGPTAKLAS